MDKAIVLALLALMLAGCHSDPQVAILERDNNRKELEIYRLRGRVQELEDQLCAASPAPGVISSEPGTRPAAPGEIPSSPSAGTVIHPRGPAPPAAPANEEPPGPSMEPLHISPGIESDEVPGTLRAPGGIAPGDGTRRSPPPGGTEWRPSSDVRLAAGESIETDNRTVMQITLHPALTGGIGRGEGDVGLLVVVEPRDIAGSILPVPGATSVALIDPVLQGESARLARWDFSAAQTARMTHTGSEPGIHLRLPWRIVPAHDRLKVFVRYTTRDGRKLQAERVIAVALHDAADDRPEPSPKADPEPIAHGPQRPQWSPDR